MRDLVERHLPHGAFLVRLDHSGRNLPAYSGVFIPQCGHPVLDRFNDSPRIKTGIASRRIIVVARLVAPILCVFFAALDADVCVFRSH
jgi:hypothetical protein